jgi:tripartite-type tricarboxylate transporter receptor subunit TctC
MEKIHMNFITRRGLAALALAAVVAPAMAQKTPIKFVVPYPAGGAADQITRLVAHETSVILATPIVIDNKAGAAGMIAGDIVARAEPDGKTFFVGSNAPLVINQALYSKMPYDPEKSFIPVSGMGKSPLLLVTRQNLGAKDVASLIAMGKKDPGKITMGSASSGNITHLAGEAASAAMGFKVTHVPFTGSAPAITSMMGGNVDIMFDALPSSMQQAKAGKITPLAILDSTRFAQLPDVPTMKELGYPTVMSNSTRGIAGPKGMPEPIVSKLRDVLKKAMEDPEHVSKLESQGLAIKIMVGEEYAKYFADTHAKAKKYTEWAKSRPQR